MDETPVHEDYATVEHFRDVKSVEEGSAIYHIGESVALLTHDKDGIYMVTGRVYDSAYNPNLGMRYQVVDREGRKFLGNAPDSMARI